MLHPFSKQRLGLGGSHRVGKTTLARAIETYWQVPFVETTTSYVFAEHNLDPAAPMDFATRLWIQRHVLEAAENLWQRQEGNFVTDRTPLDFMGYTLADIQGDTQVDFKELESYICDCFHVINSIFTRLVLVQPAIPLVYEEGKAALNRAYMEHLNTVMLGLCHDERLTCQFAIMRREILDLQTRVVVAMGS